MESAAISLETFINSDKPVVVVFYGASCEACQLLFPIFKEVSDTFKNRIAIVKIDVDCDKKAVADYRIKGLPTIMLFQHGKQLWRQSRIVSKIEIINIIMEKCTWPELPGQEKQ